MPITQIVDNLLIDGFIPEGIFEYTNGGEQNASGEDKEEEDANTFPRVPLWRALQNKLSPIQIYQFTKYKLANVVDTNFSWRKRSLFVAQLISNYVIA